MGLGVFKTRMTALLKRGYQKIIQREPQDRRTLAEMDYFRLHALLTAEDKGKNRMSQKNRKRLRQILKQGQLFPFKLVSRSVVTMNSEVQLRTHRGTLMQITLVYPKEQDRKKKKISVLSLLGLSILGKCAGEMVSRSLVVEKIVFQPEISNRFSL